VRVGAICGHEHFRSRRCSRRKCDEININEIAFHQSDQKALECPAVFAFAVSIGSSEAAVFIPCASGTGESPAPHVLLRLIQAMCGHRDLSGNPAVQPLPGLNAAQARREPAAQPVSTDAAGRSAGVSLERIRASTLTSTPSLVWMVQESPSRIPIVMGLSRKRWASTTTR
jgi:hypothetical protein